MITVYHKTAENAIIITDLYVREQAEDCMAKFTGKITREEEDLAVDGLRILQKKCIAFRGEMWYNTVESLTCQAFVILSTFAFYGCGIDGGCKNAPKCRERAKSINPQNARERRECAKAEMCAQKGTNRGKCRRTSQMRGDIGKCCKCAQKDIGKTTAYASLMFCLFEDGIFAKKLAVLYKKRMEYEP